MVPSPQEEFQVLQKGSKLLGRVVKKIVNVCNHSGITKVLKTPKVLKVSPKLAGLVVLWVMTSHVSSRSANLLFHKSTMKSSRTWPVRAHQSTIHKPTKMLYCWKSCYKLNTEGGVLREQLMSKLVEPKHVELNQTPLNQDLCNQTPSSTVNSRPVKFNQAPVESKAIE